MPRRNPTRAVRLAREPQTFGPGGSWLDQISIELCEHIADYVTKGERNEDGLNFAQLKNMAPTHPDQVTGRLWHAVFSSMKNSISFSGLPTNEGGRVEQERKWLMMARDLMNEHGDVKINKFSIDCRAPRTIREGRYVNSIIMRIHERGKVKIDAYVPLARAADVNRTAYSFEIAFHPSHRKGATAPFFESTPSNNVRELILDNYKKNICPFRNGDVTAEKILQRCPRLTALTCNCLCEPCQAHEGGNPVWALLSEPNRIEEVTFNTNNFADVLEQAALLSQPERVNIHGRGKDSYSNAVDLRNYMAGLDMSENTQESYLNSTEVWALHVCTRMRKLKINLNRTGHRHLARTVASMPLLEDLQLQWIQCQWLNPDDPEAIGEALMGIAENTIARTVQNAIALRSFCVRRVEANVREFEEAMESMGERLEKFVVASNSPEEHVADRLIRMLYALIRHNPNVQHFEYIHVGPPHPNCTGENADMQNPLVLERKEEIDALGYTLKLRSPRMILRVPECLAFMWSDLTAPWEPDFMDFMVFE